MESSEPSEDGQTDTLVQDLLAWAGKEHDPLWRQLVDKSEALTAVSKGIRGISTLPNLQPTSTQKTDFVYKQHVVSIRPIIMPVIVAAVAKVVIAINPALDSALLPWLDLVAILERLREIYSRLNDDEITTFGVATALWDQGVLAPSISNPSVHPTRAGILETLKREQLLAPADITHTLQSLVKKGALAHEGELYRPSFWGSKQD